GDHWQRRRLVLNGCLFVLGFSAVFVAMGLGASAIGRFLTGNLPILRRLGGLVVIVFGLYMMGVLRVLAFDQERRVQARVRTPGPLNSLLLGMTFAAGWTPCIGPVLGSVLVLAGTTATAAQGALLLLAYAAGLAVPFLLVTVFLGRMRAGLRKLLPHAERIRFASGVLLVVLGVMLYTNTFVLLNSYVNWGLSRRGAAGEPLGSGVAGRSRPHHLGLRHGAGHDFPRARDGRSGSGRGFGGPGRQPGATVALGGAADHRALFQPHLQLLLRRFRVSGRAAATVCRAAPGNRHRNRRAGGDGAGGGAGAQPELPGARGRERCGPAGVSAAGVAPVVFHQRGGEAHQPRLGRTGGPGHPGPGGPDFTARRAGVDEPGGGGARHRPAGALPGVPRAVGVAIAGRFRLG